MLEKINTNEIKEDLSALAQNLGLAAMGAAMAVSFLEVAGHNRAIVPEVASLDAAGEHQQGSDPLRREREETGPHYISYGAMHRTPGRSSSK